jgi:hypothetical protein
MSFEGVKINRINGGLGGAENPDRVAVMVIGSGAVATSTGSATGLEVNTAYRLLQLSDAEALGITPERDDTENRLDHYHLSEVFRLSPETLIHLIAVPQDTKVSDLKNSQAFISALRSIEGINLIAVTGMKDETALAGAAPASVLQQAVTGAQLLVDGLAKDHIYIDAVLVEGKGSYLAATIGAMEELRTMASPNVSVIIGQDRGIAAQKAAYAGHAAVGSALGMLLVRAVHENLGSVDIEVKPSARKGELDYTLTDVKLNRFVSAGLSNGKNSGELSVDDQKQLDLQGYIHVGVFSGYAGYFFSNSHTCEEQGSDFCFIERNCIWNKAARIIRQTLIPRVRSKVEADPATGYIKGTAIDDWSARVRKALETMTAAGNCADIGIYINPNQAAVSTSPFKIAVSIVADGVVHEFEIDLGFTNKV